MKSAVFIALLAQCHVVSSSAGAVLLTKSTWEAATLGKSVFVKFFAPWCGHCKKMKPDWDDLAQEFEGSTSAVIADVDCTNKENMKWCEEVGVSGYPALRYGDPADLQEYTEGRELADFIHFVKNKLGPKCSPSNLDKCSAEDRAKVKKYMAKPLEELEADIKVITDQIKEADKEFEDYLENKQPEYNEKKRAFDQKLSDIRNTKVGFMRSVAHYRAQAAKKGVDAKVQMEEDKQNRARMYKEKDEL